jgi:AcrR family transcriptional regulator
MPKKLASREDWLDCGLTLFGSQGAQGLNVEEMAKILGCSKSSFYWYFKDRKNFIYELLLHWRGAETRSYIRESRKQATPGERFLSLFEDAVKYRRHIDVLFHLREFAQRNGTARRLLEETEEERIQYLIELLVNLGDSPAQAGLKAEMMYHYYLGWLERNKFTKPSRKQVQEQLQLVCKAFKIKLPNTI